MGMRFAVQRWESNSYPSNKTPEEENLPQVGSSNPSNKSSAGCPSTKMQEEENPNNIWPPDRPEEEILDADPQVGSFHSYKEWLDFLQSFKVFEGKTAALLAGFLNPIQAQKLFVLRKKQ